MRTKKAVKEQTFEEALQRLEEIVELLENGQLPLEESIASYKEGIALSKFCSEKLAKVQEEVHKVVVEDRGNYTLELFTEGEEK